MKSRGVRPSRGWISNVRAAARTPSWKVYSKTEAFDAPPTYTRSPLGEKVNCSQPSGTGAEPVALPVAVEITEIDGGRYPALSTSRYFPSRESAVEMGSVSSAICRPAGARRHPELSRNDPSGIGPTSSRGGG